MLVAADLILAFTVFVFAFDFDACSDFDLMMLLNFFVTNAVYFVAVFFWYCFFCCRGFVFIERFLSVVVFFVTFL